MLDERYLAGFFDGEGSVCINKNGYDKRSPKGRELYTLLLSITQANEEFIQSLQSQYGGYVTKTATKGRGIAKRDAWDWRIVGEKAEPFIKAIKPHVRLKCEQLDVALRYIETVREGRALARACSRNPKPGIREAMDDALDARRKLKEELAELRAPT